MGRDSRHQRLDLAIRKTLEQPEVVTHQGVLGESGRVVTHLRHPLGEGFDRLREHQVSGYAHLMGLDRETRQQARVGGQCP